MKMRFGNSVSVKHPLKRIYSQMGVGLCVALSTLFVVNAQGQDQAKRPAADSLVQMLESKGVLTATDVAQINGAGSTSQANKRLADILLAKGVISQADHDRLVAQASAAESTQGSGTGGFTASENAQSPPNVTEPGAPSLVERAPSRTINEALVPIRALPVGNIPRGALKPAFKLGDTGVTPYGFIKLTAIWDSSSPNGDDFPLPGFLTDTGPNGSPEFHLKSRSTRFGTNFEWMDRSSKWTITGKIEADFEGNFNRSDNRNLSTIRSNNPSLRLAYGRLDYKFNSSNSAAAVFGQDWTPFVSSTLPNLLETTGLGIFFGDAYERLPQMRFGYAHKTGSFQIQPEFAIVLPASGLPPSAANISQQLGYGERQGPDSGQPQVQARIVAQWQLDHAKGVPPAQIILSGENGRSTAIVTAAGIPKAYQSTFATGASVDHKTDGWDAEYQLPTRFFTLIGKYYDGSDLRFYFAGQLYSFFNDLGGLTSIATAPSIDGASTVAFGTNASGQQVIAPERPVRTVGGFSQLGIPLSRIFNADPEGRNAGWSIYATYGVDQAKTRDLRHIGAAGSRRYSTMAIGTLNYKLNRYVSFSYEQSLYTTHANPEEPLPLFRGVPSREWNDVREEMGPIFTF